MSDVLEGIDSDVEFDFGVAEDVISAFNNCAQVIDGQKSSRSGDVETGKKEFKGHFSTLFADNARTAASDADELCTQLRQVATSAGELRDSAKSENERRRQAREWVKERDSRGEIEKAWDHAVGDRFMGHDEPPVGPADVPPKQPQAAAPPKNRETPAPGGSGGGGGGVSSAVPGNLRSFARGSSGNNEALASKPGELRGKLSDFKSQCKWGTLNADALMGDFDKWLELNKDDVDWANTVADAFEEAGGDGNVKTVSDAALQASLEAKGVSASRQDLTVSPPQVVGHPPTSGYANDPVNTATGNFIEPETDLGFAGASSALALTRMYNSVFVEDDASRTGAFGPGWSSILDARLLLNDEGATWVFDDGRHVVFPREGSGWGRAEAESFWLTEESRDQAQFRALSRLVDEAGVDDADPFARVLVIRDNVGSWVAFTRSGSWLGSGSGTGNTVAALRNNDGEITRLVHERGRWIDLEYSSGRVVVARASDGRRVEYVYDDNTHLIQVLSETGTREYRIGDNGLIAAVVAETGVVEVTNTYDDKGRVTGQVSEHGRRIRYGYLPGRVTVVSDDDGTSANTWIADARGRVVGIIDTDDNRQSMAYDNFGNRVSVTERDGSVTARGFDSRGRLVREVTPEGGDFTYGYDEQDRTTTVVTDAGAVVEYEYQDDVERNPSVIVDPMGGRTQLTWTDGLLRQVVDPEGVSVRFDYDDVGDLVSSTNAAGETARLVRDSAGRVTEAITPSGASTTYEYDKSGLLVSRTDPDGSRWRFEHGAGGRMTAMVDPAGARTELEYGPSGDLVATVDPLGRRVSRVFDQMGNVESLILPDDAAWNFTHDGLSQVRKIIDPAGGSWTRDYDKNGVLISVTDPTGVSESVDYDRTTRFEQVRDAFSSVRTDYDQYGRPTKTTSADGSSELTTYDACGRPVELVDADGGLTQIEYDLAGRTTAITTPGGKTSRFTYDVCGRPETEVDPGGAVTRLVYDAGSRVIQRILPSGDTESVTYDVMGRVVEATSPGRGTARYGYDKVGNLVSVADGRYGQRRFAYDAAGQLIQATNGLGGKTRFEYDVRGRLVRVTDPLGGVTEREYDELDQVVRSVDPSGRVTTGGYDAAGRQVWQKEPTGQVTEWEFDEAGLERSVRVDGRLIAETTRRSSAREVSVTDYTCPDAEAVHTLSFDRLGRLVRRDLETATERTSMSWGYDADGARTFMETPSGRTEYSYDSAGQLVSVRTPAAGEVTLEHDVEGRLVGAVSGAGRQSWEYRDGQMVTHQKVSQDGVSSSTQVSYDAAGRVASVDQSDGGLTVYSYDEASQLVASRTTGSTGSGIEDRRWVYDLAGRLVRESVDGVEFTYSYDEASQLMSVVGTDGSEASFVYDGLGRRVRETRTDGSVRHFAWGPTGFLESVTTDDAVGGAVSAIDVWVDATGEPRSVNGTPLCWDSASVVPALAGVGEIPVVASVAGVAVGGSWVAAGWRPARETLVSDPWSVPGLGADVAGFFGQGSAVGGVGLTAGGALSLDGLEWMGARVYDRGSRGFLSVDPLDPVVGSGWSGNPYSFAGNDPVGALDPLGLKPVSPKELEDYRQEHTFFGGIKKFANDHADTIAKIAIGAGAVALVAGAIVTGPVGMIALGAASGALISGGMSVFNNKNADGTVNWGKVGVDSLIGGAAGAVGGGVSSVLKYGGAAVASSAAKAGSAVSSKFMGTSGGQALNYASAAVQSKVGAVATKEFTPMVGKAGQEMISGAASGSVENTGQYLNYTKDKSLGGAAQAFATGGVVGGATSFGGAKLKAKDGVKDYAYPGLESNGLSSGVKNVGIDAVQGGAQSSMNYLGTPGDQPHTLDEAGAKFVNGAASGGVKSGIKTVSPAMKEPVLQGYDSVKGGLQNLTNPLNLYK